MANNSKHFSTDGRKIMLGLDIGSVSLNTVLLDEKYNVVENYYDYVHGKPFHVLNDFLKSILQDR